MGQQKPPGGGTELSPAEDVPTATYKLHVCLKTAAFPPPRTLLKLRVTAGGPRSSQSIPQQGLGDGDGRSMSSPSAFRQLRKGHEVFPG